MTPILALCLAWPRPFPGFNFFHFMVKALEVSSTFLLEDSPQLRHQATVTVIDRQQCIVEGQSRESFDVAAWMRSCELTTTVRQSTENLRFTRPQRRISQAVARCI